MTDTPAEARVHSFAARVPPGARVLVLGSMPGVRSLEEGRYYAHPRNAFWPIVAEVFGWDPSASWEARMRGLAANGVGLWDVLGSCVRPGSLDSAIDARTAVPNDFAGLLDAHPGLRRILFNGTKAWEVWHRRVAPALGERGAGLELLRMPSTSPAHASVPFSQKLAVWREGLLLPDAGPGVGPVDTEA